MRYCNSLRIFVRASSLVGAVTSTWPVDEPVCRANPKNDVPQCVGTIR
jgi:hypothetical protein